MSKRKDVLVALRCCREGGCEKCPLQDQICDELFVDMEEIEIPTELMNMIEDELAGE